MAISWLNILNFYFSKNSPKATQKGIKLGKIRPYYLALENVTTSVSEVYNFLPYFYPIAITN